MRKLAREGVGARGQPDARERGFGGRVQCGLAGDAGEEAVARVRASLRRERDIFANGILAATSK